MTTSTNLILLVLITLFAILFYRLTEIQREHHEDTAQIIEYLDGLSDTVAEAIICPPEAPQQTPLVLQVAESISKINRKLTYAEAVAFGEAIEQASEIYALPPDLLFGMIVTESTGNPRAKNGSCLGPMQVSKKWWDKALREAGIVNNRNDYFEIMNGIMAGAFVLDHYLAKHDGDLRAALVAYSGGAKNYPDKVYKHGGLL